MLSCIRSIKLKCMTFLQIHTLVANGCGLDFNYIVGGANE